MILLDYSEHVLKENDRGFVLARTTYGNTIYRVMTVGGAQLFGTPDLQRALRKFSELFE